MTPCPFTVSASPHQPLYKGDSDGRANNDSRVMILTLDTSTSFLVLGIVGSSFYVEYSLEVGKAHAEALGPAVVELLRHGEQPTLIAVGTGPGSYTGLRIGASFAQGLGKAMRLPVVGVNSFEAIALNANGVIAVSRDAGRGQTYGGIYAIENDVILQVKLPLKKWGTEEFQKQTTGIQVIHNQCPTAKALATLVIQGASRSLSLLYI